MTQRERDIYQIIQADPMISQNEIAKKLGITRSAVSAYLVTMTKKGIIKGKGYIINPEGYALIIGPGHIDIETLCLDKGLRKGMHDSIGTTICYGGASKNVAQYYARLGGEIKGIFTVTTDFFGQNFLSDCKKHNIDSDSSLVLHGMSMPVYNEIANVNGEIIASATVIDNLAEYLTADFLASKASVISSACNVIVHDSLPYDAIEYLTSTYDSEKLVYFSTYLSMTSQHENLLDRFGLIMMSFDTAYGLVHHHEAVSGDSVTRADVQQLCGQLHQKGLSNVIIPYSLSSTCFLRGSQGLIMEVSHEDTDQYPRSSYRFYRDASMSSIVYSMNNYSTDEDLLLHLAASKLIAASGTLSKNNYCAALVQSTVQKINFSTYKFVV